MSGGNSRGRMETGKENPYSCTVLAGGRSMQERRMALEVSVLCLVHSVPNQNIVRSIPKLKGLGDMEALTASDDCVVL